MPIVPNIKSMKTTQLLPFLCAVGLFITAMPRAHGEEILVAAAADLTYCMDDLDKAFQEKHPDAVVKVSAGSSGNFFAQIKNGAPFDVFLSADMSYPKDLAKAGLADESSL